jgi:hypothetical protein
VNNNDIFGRCVIMAYTSDSILFKSLDDAEELLFQEYAAGCDPPTGSKNWDLFHPVCRQGWRQRGLKPLDELIAEGRA